MMSPRRNRTHALPIVGHPAAPPPRQENIDPYGRAIDYLRVSLTDRCNFRCTYCMPPEGVVLHQNAELLNDDERFLVLKAAKDIGFKKFRITGGEPLVYKNFQNFIKGIRGAIGDAELCLTTNGYFLDKHLDVLEAVGLSRLNISLDTLDANQFETMTRRRGLDRVLKNIQLSVVRSFKQVSINAVVQVGVNEREALDLASLAEDQAIDIRYIEHMQTNNYQDGGYVASSVLQQQLSQKYDLVRVTADDARQAARSVFRSAQLKGRIAFISPRSDKFCDNCNRMRLTPNGELKGCLLSQSSLELKDVMRSGGSYLDIKNIFKKAIGQKPEYYQDQDYGLDRPMSGLGG